MNSNWTDNGRVFISLGAALSLLLSGCGGADDPVPGEQEPTVETVEEKVHPELSLLAPQRGLFTDQEQILIQGEVVENSAPVENIEVNGTAALPHPSGTFQAEMPLHPGPNIFGVRAEATDGGRAVEAVSVFAGDTWTPGAKIENALQIHLGADFLDDDDPDLDDVATVVELLVSDEQFLQAFISEPFMVGDNAITVTKLEVGAGEVDIVPETNCVDVTLTVKDPDIEMSTEGFASIFGETVFVVAGAATVHSVICGAEPPVEGIELEVTETEVTFEELEMSTDQHPDFKESLPTTHDAVQTLIEDALATWLGGSLGGLMTGFLRDFALSQSFGTSPKIDVDFEVSGLEATPDGLAVDLDGSISAPFALPSKPKWAGSLRTDDPPLSSGVSESPVSLAVSDDTLNQLLFALWWGNGASNTEIPPEAESELPEVFQPLMSFAVDQRLPATLIEPANEEYSFDLAAGAIGLEIVAGQGRFDAGLHIRVGVDLIVEEEGKLTLELDDRAQKITVEANVAEAPPTVEKGDVAALFRFIVPPVLGETNVSLKGFPLPEIDLSSFSENAAAFEGRTLRFVPQGSSRAGEGGGYLMVEGTFEESSGSQ